MHMVDSSHSREIAVESSTTGKAEERTTPVRTRTLSRKQQATISQSCSNCWCDRLHWTMTPAGWHRKGCEGVVLVLAIVIGLAITSVPIVLYFILAVSMCHVAYWNQDIHIRTSKRNRYPFHAAINKGYVIKKESQKMAVLFCERVCIILQAFDLHISTIFVVKVTMLYSLKYYLCLLTNVYRTWTPLAALRILLHLSTVRESVKE